MNPVEILKVRFQSQGGALGGMNHHKYRSAREALSGLLKEEGFKGEILDFPQGFWVAGLWKGVSTSVTRLMVSNNSFSDGKRVDYCE